MRFDSYLNKLKSIVCDISLIVLISILIIAGISYYIKDNPALVVSLLLSSVAFIYYIGYVVYTKEIKLRIPMAVFLVFGYIASEITLYLTPWVGYKIDSDLTGYGSTIVLNFYYLFEGLFAVFLVSIIFDVLLWASQFIVGFTIYKKRYKPIEAK